MKLKGKRITDEIKKILSAIIKILKEKYKPEKVILFGSSIWGEFTKDSDIDLLIINKNFQLGKV